MAAERGKDLFHVKEVLFKRGALFKCGAKAQNIVHHDVDHNTTSERSVCPRDAS
jgi:hypothetical protein